MRPWIRATKSVAVGEQFVQRCGCTVVENADHLVGRVVGARVRRSEKLTQVTKERGD